MRPSFRMPRRQLRFSIAYCTTRASCRLPARATALKISVRRCGWSPSRVTKLRWRHGILGSAKGYWEQAAEAEGAAAFPGKVAGARAEGVGAAARGEPPTGPGAGDFKKAPLFFYALTPYERQYLVWLNMDWIAELSRLWIRFSSTYGCYFSCAQVFLLCSIAHRHNPNENTTLL